MSSMEELEARVAALEAQIGPIRQDAAAARVLAGGADRDVSAFAARLDVHKALLEALRETQIEHGRRLGGVEGRLDGVEGRLSGVEGRLDRVEQKVDSGFGTLAVGQAEILTLLNRLTDQP